MFFGVIFFKRMKLVGTVIICCFVEAYGQFFVRDLRLTIYKLQSCPNTQHLPVQFTNIKLKHGRDGNQILDTDAVVRKDLPESLRAKLILEKCTSRESPDTCMQYTSINTQHLCKMLALPNTAVSDYLNKIEPRWICPVKKGHYICRNCSFNINQFKMFPIEDTYWKLRCELLDPNRGTLLACVLTETEVHRHL